MEAVEYDIKEELFVAWKYFEEMEGENVRKYCFHDEGKAFRHIFSLSFS